MAQHSDDRVKMDGPLTDPTRTKKKEYVGQYFLRKKGALGDQNPVYSTGTCEIESKAEAAGGKIKKLCSTTD